jgi:hypothetical protein
MGRACAIPLAVGESFNCAGNKSSFMVMVIVTPIIDYYKLNRGEDFKSLFPHCYRQQLQNIMIENEIDSVATA